MENTLKFKITTAMIIGGLIFLASFLSTWITHNKELNAVQADQKVLSAIVVLNSNRIIVLEQYVLSTKSELSEIKFDVKEIQRDQRLFYQKMGMKIDK